MSKGYVYILSNESMPGIVKIGKTTRDSESRAAELYQTGVPTPFKVEFEIFTPDCNELEAMAHERLAKKRVSSAREFFNTSPIEAESVIQILLESQVHDFISEYYPGHSLIWDPLVVEPADLSVIADKCGVHPTIIPDAIYLIEPEEILPAIKRSIERRKKLKEQARLRSDVDGAVMQ